MAPRPDPPRDNAVRAHRRRAELTQAHLAELVGVSRQTVVAIESGGYAPSVYLALALAAALDTTVETLFAPVTEPTTATGAPDPATGAQPVAAATTGDARVR